MPDLRRVLVSSVDDIAEGVRKLTFTPTDGAPLPAWEPGAHIDVVLPSRLVRQYSLCGDPNDLAAYQIAVLRESAGRGGSEEIHRLDPGTEITIAEPRNRFPLHEAAEYLFIAGGIGITPLLPMMAAVQQRGLPWRLVYGGRSRASMGFLDHLEALGPQVEVRPQDEYGLLDLEEILAPRPGALVYCCGPEPLLNAVEAKCSTTWPADTLIVERFTAAAEDAVPADGGDAFEVQLGEDGPVLQIPPDQTILKVLQDADADVLFSCEEGTCGSCETQVLRGRPDHRDSLLTEDNRADGLMLICVSRSLDQRLVLDVEAPPHLT